MAYNNPTEDYEIEFDSTDLWDCLEYAKKYNDFEPLGFALNLHNKKIAEAKEQIDFLIETAQVSKRLDFYIKGLNKVKKLIK